MADLRLDYSVCCTSVGSGARPLHCKWAGAIALSGTFFSLGEAVIHGLALCLGELLWAENRIAPSGRSAGSLKLWFWVLIVGCVRRPLIVGCMPRLIRIEAVHILHDVE